MDGRVQFSGLGSFSAKRLATLAYSVVSSLVCLVYCVWTILIFTNEQFKNNYHDCQVSLVIISLMGVLAQAIGFYAIASKHLLVTYLFMMETAFNCGFLFSVAIYLRLLMLGFGAALNLAGFIIIMPYYLELKKARREQGKLISSASGN